MSSVWRAGRVIALTFDDGWSPDRCKTIESILLRQHVAATWFPNARYIGWDPALWRDIAAHFPIGNHTVSHLDLTKLAVAHIEREISDDETEIEAVTGRPMVPILRPPYGAYDDRVLQVAAALGYRTIAMWDVDDHDAQGASETVALADAERGGPGSIVLMHCGPAVTPLILPRIIDFYRSHGFRFVTLPALLDGSAGK